MSNQPQLITLASASPRRRALLEQLGHPIQISPSEIDERAQSHEHPKDFALRMSIEKARFCANQTHISQPRWIVAGDTVVALKDQILGKPKDRWEAIEMLSRLSGQTHEVWSGWAIFGRDGSPLTSGVSQGVVTFRELTLDEIEEYVDTGEPMDKAGSYGIQGLGGRFVHSFKGSFNGVIGMPLAEVAQGLISVGAIQPKSLFLLRQSIQIRERIKVAAWSAHRPIDEVRLLAVSKRQPLERLKEATQYQLFDFGESYVQEWLDKRERFRSELAELDDQAQPSWHFIGAIQKNKAKRIGAAAHWIHGLSRKAEADRLHEGAVRAARSVKVLIQVNLSREETKGGVTPDQVVQLIRHCDELPKITVEGLMTFPPLGTPEESREYFRALKVLRDELKTEKTPLHHLSMGTSHDFPIAIEEGATWVRVGSALFGERS